MSSQPLGSWIDGAQAHSVPIADRGLQYGDGLFETILVRDGVPRFIEAHLARLSQGCGRLRISFEAHEGLREDIARAASMAGPLAILKIMVTRGSATRRGYRPHNEVARRVVSLWSAAALPAAIVQGVELRVADLRISEQPALAGLKHLNRLEQVLAATESDDPRFFESLMLDAAGGVICGTMSNVFLVDGNTLSTPPVDRCGIAGVMRQMVLRESAGLGYKARETAFDLLALNRADAAFITNARIGVVPVRCVGEHVFAMNEAVQKLRAHLESLNA